MSVLNDMLQKASEFSKADMEKEKEPFYFIDKTTGERFEAFTKTGINAINAKAGTGKSLLLTEIAFFLLASKQVKRVIWLDLDNNYTTLKKRNQSKIINDFGDSFLLLTDEQLLATAQTKRQEIASELVELQKTHTDEQLQSGLYSEHYNNLIKMLNSLNEMLEKYDFLGILEAILLDSDYNLSETSIFIDSLGDLFDAGKAEIIQPIFFEILRPLNNRGASLWYLNHLTKDNGTGKKNYSGSHKLLGKTDCFTIVTRAEAKNTLNIEIDKDRHGAGINLALNYDIYAPLGQRLFKCEFIPNFANEIIVGADVKTDKQATNLARIKSLFFGKSPDLKLSYGDLRNQTGLSDNQLSTILKSDGFLRDFEKTRDGYYRRQMIAPSAEVIPD